MIFYYQIKDKRNYILICIISILFNNGSLIAQKGIRKNKTDYSVNIPYQKFHELEENALAESNLGNLREIVKFHLRRAKKENNNIEIGRAFYYRILTEEPELGLIYSDSMINITENSLHPNYPTLG